MCDRDVLIKSECSERQKVQALKITEADRILAIEVSVWVPVGLAPRVRNPCQITRTVITSLPAMVRAFLSSAQQYINDDCFLLVKLEKKHPASYMHTSSICKAVS